MVQDAVEAKSLLNANSININQRTMLNLKLKLLPYLLRSNCLEI